MEFKKSVSSRIKSAVLSIAVLAGSLTSPAFSAENRVSAADDVEINYAKALQYSIYFYDANMCGTEVAENNRYTWRGNCHTYDASVELTAGISDDFVGTNLSQEFIDKYKDVLDPDGDGCVDVAGGFHDAGDHVEFGMPENYTAATLGWGYYEFRDAYAKTGQDEHIETILRYFNDYLMKCTFRDKSGKVIAHCYQVGDGDIDHAYWNSPEVDEMGRPAFFLTAEKPQIDYTASAAASLALNYLNFKDTDPEYAEKSLDYAQALWDFSIQALEDFNVSVSDPESYNLVLSDNGDGPKGYYRSEKWVDDFCWAAGWMYLCTGDKAPLEAAVQFYDYYAPSGWCYCWNDVWSGAACLWARINQEHPELDLINMIRTAQGKNQYVFDNIWEEVAKCLPTWQQLETPQGYAFLNQWGSARYNTAMQLIGLVYDKYTNDGKPGEFSQWAAKQMAYLMGDNDLTFKEASETGSDVTHGHRSMIVGYSDNAVKFPHHRAASGLTKCEDPDDHRYVLYGALAGGPDGSDCHNDITKDYIYNEVTIDYNAAFVGACAGLYEYFGTPDMEVTPDFPPPPTYGGNGEEEAGNKYWITACGIDDLNADGAGVTKVSLYVMTNSTKSSKKIKVRYYFSAKEMSDPSNVKCSELYDQAAVEAAPANGEISGPYKYDKMDDIYYVEIDFDGYNIGNSGKKYQFTVGLYYGDKWDPSNDPSYQELKLYDEDDAFFGTGNEVKNEYICVYDDGVLVGGTEPDGSIPEVTTAPTTEEPEKTTTSAKVTTSESKTTTTTAATTTEDSKPATTTTKATPASSDEDTGTSQAGGEALPEATLLGDVTCDGIVDIKDVALLSQYIVKLAKLKPQALANANVISKDNVVNIKDLTQLKRYLTQEITKF